jgi:hypothetical protein
MENWIYTTWRLDPDLPKAEIRQTSCLSCTFDRKCPTPHQLERHDGHWWSGWPGAWCMGCGVGDPSEVCLSGDCGCLCHDQLWEEYNQYLGEPPNTLEYNGEPPFDTPS